MDRELEIVIPVYNEETSLQPLIEDWRNLLNSIPVNYQFLFVDDGSTDRSLALLKTWQQASPDILVLSQSNAGHGPAILKGYHHACRTPWVLQLDSDHQLTPAAFPELWRRRDDYDLLLGQRHEKHAAGGRRLISGAPGYCSKAYSALPPKTSIAPIACSAALHSPGPSPIFRRIASLLMSC